MGRGDKIEAGDGGELIGPRRGIDLAVAGELIGRWRQNRAAMGSNWLNQPAVRAVSGRLEAVGQLN